jgi:hypothetical protein
MRDLQPFVTTVLPLPEAVIALDAKLDDHDVSFAASMLLEGEAALHASSDRVHVPVMALNRASLLAITGRTNVDATATFACLQTWFGNGVPSKIGQAQVRLVYEHDRGGPHLASFEAEATGTEVATPAESTRARVVSSRSTMRTPTLQRRFMTRTATWSSSAWAPRSGPRSGTRGRWPIWSDGSERR